MANTSYIASRGQAAAGSKRVNINIRDSRKSASVVAHEISASDVAVLS